METRYHFSTKDLVTIALLSALGGGLSTYIGYLGNLINRMVGVPFGAGQFMAGLHVIWIVLAVGITRKKGVGTATGMLKGLVELFLGGTHGVVIVVVSLIQGLLVDAVLFNDSTKEKRGLVPYSMAGGVSAASNVFVFQVFFFSGVPFILILMLAILACGSGMIFGGYITLQMMDSLEQGGLIHKSVKEKERVPVSTRYASIAVTVIFITAFTAGGIYYFQNVYVPPGTEEINIVGNVNREYVFTYNDFQKHEITVSAELIGSVSHIPEKNYTGIPLGVIIAESGPLDDAVRVEVVSTDGYSAVFDLSDVMENDAIIVSNHSGEYMIVANEYDGAYWVKDVYEIRIE
ncbi:MAG: ECF transporter S component [Thermoplasmata archaeon]